MGNRFNIRIEGTRIKHTMGPVSIKLYHKFGLLLRIETTVNDLSFFKHYREVEHRDGSREQALRALGSRRTDDPASTRRSAGYRAAERVFAVVEAPRGRDYPGTRGTGHRP